MTITLPGLDIGRVSAWMDDTLPGLRQGPLHADLVSGGKSNLTYRLSDGVTDWALRRPPLAHVLPTAHDMVREYTVIRALGATPVPVPETVGLCTDTDVIGVPFFVMSFVDGVVLDRREIVDALDREHAARVGDTLIDCLVALHAVQPEAVGLGDFGHPDGFLRRQIRRWHQQWQASETRPLSLEAEVVELLGADVPVSPAPSIVHGDYRGSNVIYTADVNEIAAVIDWEMSTLGDPLTDVGLLVVYHALAEESDATTPMMRPADGFRSPARLVERYAGASGRDVSRIEWYIALGFFKLAVIVEGIAARHRQGKTVGAGFEGYQSMAPGLLERARTALGR